MAMIETRSAGTPSAASRPGGLAARALAAWPLWAITVATVAARWATRPTYVDSRDGLFFIRSLDSYSVVNLRPHWPGYPVYVWVGRLAKAMVGDPLDALQLVSIVAGAAIIWPLAALAARARVAALAARGDMAAGGSASDGRLAGIAAACMWALVPGSWLTGTEVYSDSLALLLGLCVLLLCCRALEREGSATHDLVVAAALGGLMLGVRLSYLWLLAPLAWAAWSLRRERVGRWSAPLAATAAGAAACWVWFSWQIAEEGAGFVTAGSGHLSGHYGKWGGGVSSDPRLTDRPLRFAESVLANGLGSWWPGAPIARVGASVVLGVLVVAGVVRLWRAGAPAQALLLFAVPYKLWILVGNDVDLARYGLPLVAVACVVAAVGLPATAPRRAGGLVAAVALAVALAAVTVPLAVAHRTELPIANGLARYVRDHLRRDRAVVIVSDAAPFLIHLVEEETPGYRTTRVRAPRMASAARSLAARGEEVYATAHPRGAPAGWVPVARVCRDRWIESRGPHEMWLYRYAPGAAPSPVGPCR